MGAYSPAPVVDGDQYQRIMDEVIRPTLAGMVADGQPFTGFLYAGIMLTDSGPKVLEYNARFGDPETQPILFRLKSDLVAVLNETLAGRLDAVELVWDERFALGVVMAAGGYPEAYAKGLPIRGLDADLGDAVKVFHAGTTLDENGQVVTSGGRVLCVTALGLTVADAQAAALKGVSAIDFDEAFFRNDIGGRAIGR